ncbi:SOS response-associated peptidase family protein [Arsukibacterium sp.]|uniref:SOS response-associated peptidase family protein n=1 Tax=Arsukibacterium sp. TaxID=1977258 RepID=UPI00299E2845|nr:SOS response-associated peptidase family protein [Arsukibacterium sp.]MDX1538306.1 SOS response-associated peptidase family protein [Arsukibacterium sp.]
MCGRLNVIDDPGVIELCEGLQISLFADQPIFSRFIRATQPVSIVRQQQGVRRMDTATWWLLLDKTDTGFKPSKYTSFNTRCDKLNVKNSAGYLAFRHSRCVIPVKGFGESEYVNGKPLHYHDMVAKHGGLLMGGLCREWFNSETGESALSCSVITLPPHPKLKNIHSKSMPMILPPQSDLVNAWLNENITSPTMFDDLLKPRIPVNLIAQQIDKPGIHQSVAPEFEISADN